MDLQGASVFLDFDGTVTTYDSGLWLMERLAPDTWREVEELYLAGAIGSRQCMVEQWKLLPRDRDLIESVTREVPLDPGFPSLVAFLRSAGADLKMVSDGFGFRAQEIAEDFGLSVTTNAIDWDTFEITFPNGDESCPCSECGTCKQSPIRMAQRSASMTVLVGDGASDAKAAEIADMVFAKDHLADWCSRTGIPHGRFSDLTDLVARLAEVAATTSLSEPSTP